MVDRFLFWRLPEDFNPDCGIQFDADGARKIDPRNHRYEPVGTNLFSAEQATAMVRYMLCEDACEKHGKEDCMECFYTTQPIEPIK